MAKSRYQTRLPADQAERVDEYVKNHDISQSEAVRRLILSGLDHEDGETVTRAEIQEDLRQLQADNDDGDGDTHIMGQQNATQIAYYALLIIAFILGNLAPF